MTMDDWTQQIIEEVEPWEDSVYGPMYRCSLTLRDDTFLPCAVLQSKKRLLAFAERRIKEEWKGRGIFRKKASLEKIVSSLVANDNRVMNHEVAAAAQSQYAIPFSLLQEIESETTMGWTGWVFRMNDGNLFSFGSAFRMQFFQLPEGYGFQDVGEVINHCYLDPQGRIARLECGARLPEDYSATTVYRERIPIHCAVDGI